MRTGEKITFEGLQYEFGGYTPINLDKGEYKLYANGKRKLLKKLENWFYNYSEKEKEYFERFANTFPEEISSALANSELMFFHQDRYFAINIWFWFMDFCETFSLDEEYVENTNMGKREVQKKLLEMLKTTRFPFKQVKWVCHNEKIEFILLIDKKDVVF